MLKARQQAPQAPKAQRSTTYSIWTIGPLNTTAIKEEADGAGCFALSLAEGVHQFLQGSGALDLEEDLVVVVRDLDIEMLVVGASLWLLWNTRTSILIRSRHFPGCGCERGMQFVKMAVLVWFSACFLKYLGKWDIESADSLEGRGMRAKRGRMSI